MSRTRIEELLEKGRAERVAHFEALQAENAEVLAALPLEDIQAADAVESSLRARGVLEYQLHHPPDPDGVVEVWKLSGSIPRGVAVVIAARNNCSLMQILAFTAEED